MVLNTSMLLGMTDRDAVALPDPEDQPTVTVQEAARLLGLARASAYEGVRRGEIPTVRIGRRLLVPTALLRRMLGFDTVSEPQERRLPVSETEGASDDQVDPSAAVRKPW